MRRAEQDTQRWVIKRTRRRKPKKRMRREPSERVLEKFHFDIVHGCPMRCVGCPMSTHRWKLEYADPKAWGKCLQNVDVERVHLFRLFNFSDPLLHPKLPDFMDQIRRAPWKVDRVEISTTGQFFDKEKMIETLKRGILTLLFVSCDGDSTPEEYERLRPPSKWDKLVRFLDEMKELRDTYAPHLHLGTRTICPDKGARAAWDKILNPRGWKPIYRMWKDLPESAENPSDSKHECANGVCVFMDDRKGERLYVDADGTVVGCCRHPRAFVLGNLGKQKYSEIRSGSKRKRMLQQLKHERRRMKICGRCSA